VDPEGDSFWHRRHPAGHARARKLARLGCRNDGAPDAGAAQRFRRRFEARSVFSGQDDEAPAPEPQTQTVRVESRRPSGFEPRVLRNLAGANREKEGRVGRRCRLSAQRLLLAFS
jgi:hypothetical protein